MQIEPYHMQQKTYQFQIKLDVALDTVEERTEAQNQILSAYIMSVCIWDKFGSGIGRTSKRDFDSICR